MTRWTVAAKAVVLGVCLFVVSHRAGAESAPGRDPARWGVLGEVAGQQWRNAENEGLVRIDWIAPDQLGFWQVATGRYTRRVVPGPEAGTLELTDGDGLFAVTYVGRVEADGGLVFVSRNLVKQAFRIERSPQGGWMQRWVKVQRGEPTGQVYATSQYVATVATGGAVPPGARQASGSADAGDPMPGDVPVAAPSTPAATAVAAPATEQPARRAADAAATASAFGPFEQVLGRRMVGRVDLIEFNREGDGLRIQFHTPDGRPLGSHLIRPSADKPGRLELAQATQGQVYWPKAELEGDGTLRVQWMDKLSNGWRYTHRFQVRDGDVVLDEEAANINIIGIVVGREQAEQVRYEPLTEDRVVRAAMARMDAAERAQLDAENRRIEQENHDAMIAAAMQGFTAGVAQASQAQVQAQQQQDAFLARTRMRAAAAAMVREQQERERSRQAAPTVAAVAQPTASTAAAPAKPAPALASGAAPVAAAAQPAKGAVTPVKPAAGAASASGSTAGTPAAVPATAAPAAASKRAASVDPPAPPPAPPSVPKEEIIYSYMACVVRHTAGKTQYFSEVNRIEHVGDQQVWVGLAFRKYVAAQYGLPPEQLIYDCVLDWEDPSKTKMRIDRFRTVAPREGMAIVETHWVPQRH